MTAARSLGPVVREAWLAWAKEQPDCADHPSWLVPWEELPQRERDVDERIAQAVAAALRDPSQVLLRRYVLPSIDDDGWAIIVLGSDGYFSAVTDYSNVAFRWRAHGCEDFRTFLISAGENADRYPDHLLEKLFDPCVRERYDGEKTLQRAKELIIATRRNGCRSKEAAREAWRELEYYEDLEHEWAYVDWLYHAVANVLTYDERSECRCTSPCGDALSFVRKVMPRLADVLRRELDQGIGWDDPLF